MRSCASNASLLPWALASSTPPGMPIGWSAPKEGTRMVRSLCARCMVGVEGAEVESDSTWESSWLTSDRMAWGGCESCGNCEIMGNESCV